MFVGGTGRCGTHAVTAIAAQSGRFGAVPAEVRLHISPDGLQGFVHGGHSRRRLLRGLRTHWWRHSPAWDPAAARGAHRIVSRRRYLAALARLAIEPPGANRLFLSRRFVSSLLDPLAPTPGAWIEKSPDNCRAAPFLADLYPELRLIHVIRDGRDVASSFTRVPWAPDDFAAALANWEQSLLDAHRGTQQLPPEHVHRVLFEDLVSRDRERAYRALLAFLHIPDEPPLRSFFDRELTLARARIGRWRLDLDPSDHRRAQSLYRQALDRLDAAGVWPLPPAHPITGPAERAAAAGQHAPSPIDPWAASTA